MKKGDQLIVWESKGVMLFNDELPVGKQAIQTDLVVSNVYLRITDNYSACCFFNEVKLIGRFIIKKVKC